MQTDVQGRRFIACARDVGCQLRGVGHCPALRDQHISRETTEVEETHQPEAVGRR